jgi:hypothetical protein
VKPPLVVNLGDSVIMRKPHPCGSNQWTVTAVGMDIRLECDKCGRSVLLPRAEFERAVKTITPAKS